MKNWKRSVRSLLLRRAGITIDVVAVQGHEVTGRFELTLHM
ncbi:MAG: hypothetical protein ACLVJ6_14395 [Merdibacter sp.]